MRNIKRENKELLSEEVVFMPSLNTSQCKYDVSTTSLQIKMDRHTEPNSHH